MFKAAARRPMGRNHCNMEDNIGYCQGNSPHNVYLADSRQCVAVHN